jgi:hypothetical protein
MSSVGTQLDAMRGLQENWDGYGAAAPGAGILELAHELVAFLEAALERCEGGPLLHVCPTRTGGVLIDWEDEKAEHEVEIGPDQVISFLHVNRADGQAVTRRFAPLAQTVVNPGLLRELRQLLAA